MPHETTIGHGGRQLVMRRSGVQIPEAAPRKHVASKRVYGDSTATADPLEADLPLICHRLISVANRFCCLLGPFTRLLPSRLRDLPSRSPVLPRRLSLLMLRFRVLGRRADETGPDRTREQPSALGPRLPFLPDGLLPGVQVQGDCAHGLHRRNPSCMPRKPRLQQRRPDPHRKCSSAIHRPGHPRPHERTGCSAAVLGRPRRRRSRSCLELSRGP